ncbi:MAG TPA: transcriptional regulator [Rheinheimera sp.]|uniref:glycine cleavage system protein R n=1 Tax=Rheinheimera sp. TaxID=1869214 RepID=UPI000EC738E2|nr:ACT domain-containing protein [Rheinheimera sp.]HCU66773.1 transcriptional regulator [Rheinheimera sp.]
MAQQLVVTAIGADRTGIVSQLSRLVSDCNCNIVDSRMAIFGNEFTFIMLLSGDAAAISKIEYLLPSSGVELDLLTMTKRTSAHKPPPLSAPYLLSYTGPDKVGTLGTISSLLADHQIYIGALRSETHQLDGVAHTHTQMTVQLPGSIDAATVRSLVLEKLAQLSLTGSFELQS